MGFPFKTNKLNCTVLLSAILVRFSASPDLLNRTAELQTGHYYICRRIAYFIARFFILFAFIFFFIINFDIHLKYPC